MMPERVNWQTGGVIKTVATGFIVKPDVNGRLRYGHSKTALAKPIQLLVRTPEGTEITEYQLICLRTHSNAREFRTVTGGILHESGGSNRDDVPFDPQRIATRTWTISLPDLEPGEYGLLPPNMNDARALARISARCTRSQSAQQPLLRKPLCRWRTKAGSKAFSRKRIRFKRYCRPPSVRT